MSPRDRTFWIEVTLAIVGIAIGLPGLAIWMEHRKDNTEEVAAQVLTISNQLQTAWLVANTNIQVQAHAYVNSRTAFANELVGHINRFATNPLVSEIAVSTTMVWTFHTNRPHSSNYITIVTPTNIIMRKAPIETITTTIPARPPTGGVR